MQGFMEFSEEKKITVKTKMGGEIPATIKVTGKDYHIVKTDSGKQYKVDFKGNSLEEEIDDKDLPFTPDKKPAKPSTAGKYGSAYSTVRNLARRALEKQAKLKKEEVDLDEEHLDEKSDQARANKARKNAMDTARGHGFRLATGVPISPKDTGHKTNQQLNKALGRQLRNEEQIDERNKENALKRKTMDAARGAMYKIKTGLKVDPESTGHKTPQEFNKALGRAIRNEETELQEVNTKQIKKDLDSGLSYDAVIGKHSNKKLTNTNEIRKIIQQHAWDKRMKKEEVDLEENAPVAPSIGVHRIGVTVSDPGHTSVSKRNEKLQKFVRVTAQSKERALEQGKKHFAKKGFKVHDAEHAGMVHEEVEMSEGYRGSSKADEPYWEAQEHKQAAEKAKKSGDNFSYHKFMSAHHDAMEHWSNNKGRTSVANQHAMKADEHEDYAQQARKGSK